VSLTAELKRRKVFKVAGAYLVVGWLLIQVAATVAPQLNLPEWAPRLITFTILLGFPIVLVMAWIFDVTPEGIKVDASRVGSKRIFVVAAVLVALALGWYFHRHPAPEEAATKAGAETTAAPVAAAKSIAVLPFENLSEDKANGYFADGIQDQILTGLAKIGDLKVISRTSTQKYASRPENLSQIARELGVAHILEGSVQRSGNKVRINVQLIEAATDSHLWADTYDRTLDDVFAVESEVAQKIADSLAANLSRGERAALAEKPTDVPAAYDAYLKARVLNSKALQTRQQADEALDAYREAVRLDPKFTLAWAQLAREAFRTSWTGLDTSGELRVEGEQALARASKLAPGSVQVELARGVHMYYIERDFAGALAVMNSLKSKLPNDADVWMWAGYLSRRLGMFEESKVDFSRARELSPNDANIAYHYGVTVIATGDCGRGLRELDASLALAPDNTHALALKLQCAWSLGDLAKADAYLESADASSPAVQGLHGMQLLNKRDYAAASKELLRAIAGTGDTSIDALMAGYLPARVEWQLDLGISQQRAGATAQALETFRQAKAEALSALATKPENRYVETGWHMALGIAQAGLGERAAAAEQGRIAVTLVPESADRLEGPSWTIYQARIYAMNADATNALPLLRHLVQTPVALLSVENLRFEPFWDPIRNNPRFQALLKGAGQ
jgi:TolB-like protein/Tfp pilus assembly protein PilF